MKVIRQKQKIWQFQLYKMHIKISVLEKFWISNEQHRILIDEFWIPFDEFWLLVDEFQKKNWISIDVFWISFDVMYSECQSKNLNFNWRIRNYKWILIYEFGISYGISEFRMMHSEFPTENLIFNWSESWRILNIKWKIWISIGGICITNGISEFHFNISEFKMNIPNFNWRHLTCSDF